jgi:hypothetical protein
MPSATQAPPAVAQVQAPDVATLQSQLSDLQVQLTGVRARWDGLRSQLDEMLRTNPARPSVQQQWADAGVEMARLKGEIAFREAQLARAQGRPIGTSETAPAARFPFRSVDTNGVVAMSFIMVIVLGLPVSIAWARRIFRREPDRPFPSDLTHRLANIERAVDAISIEVERISEGQRFVTKIFVDRPAQGALSEAASASTAASSSKALGAGPIQAIDLVEREHAHQRTITPH